ncbi:hypothetical protein C6I20_05335 [Aeromicrobium sp. A1-2]|uniref:hypothetical protein n=1 Tax=Aeromicrobium sp. A1-2 TaxID=2107713 RepID=UPI000E4F4CD1|nr:hypothetical protein [Aeromicrobium sp. A1-2]AXT84670.1 hypothetical protein C6I20_05335 [Aeromicrobium sp. A1-2]
MSINSEQLRGLVDRVDGILATRRSLLPAVQREVDDAARRKSDVERLLSLLAELKEIEKDQDALHRIDGAIDDLNRLLVSFAAREGTLDALRVRFSRETVNIGVSGEARVGKSSTLQKFSGLTDTQIPTGKGLPVTAVRSEIFNSSDESAEVNFRDQKTFITEYVQPLLAIVNKHVDIPLSIDTLAGLRSADFPETLGANVDSVSTDSLGRLLDAQKSLSTYESLLTGTVRQVPLGDLRSYVAYPTKDDLDAEEATGAPANRSYIAVKSVKIFCPFPGLEGVKVGLVDLPGLGEIGASVADMHLHGLNDGVDQIFPIMRPTDAEGYAKQGIASNIDHLRRIQPGIKRRGDLITAGINVTEGLSETVETLRDDFERKINSASYDPIDVLEYTAIDDTSVAELFDTLLQRVSDRLPTMDQEVFAYALASEAGEADVTGTLEGLNRTLTELLRLIPIPEALLLRQISRIARDLIHEYNAFQKKLDDQADEHSDWYAAFDADVERIHSRSDGWIQDGFFMGRDQWEAGARGQKDYYNWYRNETQRLRREIIAQYSGLDVFYDDQVTQFKNDVIRIFFDNTGELHRKLHVNPDENPDVVIHSIAVEFGGTVQDDDLDSALELLSDVKFSFRNNVFLQISNHLKELANPSEDFELKPGSPKHGVENIREVLGVVGNYEHQLGRLRDYLTRIATEANNAIRNSLLEHDDRFHEYLSVSISFFNDFLYRKDEENFKHLVIRSLIKEYRDYILGEDTGVAIDSKKKDLIDQIKAAVQAVGGDPLDQPEQASGLGSHKPRQSMKTPKPQAPPVSTPLVDAKSDTPKYDSAGGNVLDAPWATPLPGNSH